jgi:proteasome accessory factor C
MSETTADKLRRILLLIPRLSDDKSHDIDELAAIVGVERKTLLADIRSLAERFDDPGGFVEALSIMIDDRKVSVRTSHFLRPMRFTTGELAALELGLALLKGLRPLDEQPVIDRARERLQEALVLAKDAPPMLTLRAGALGDLTPALRERRELLRGAARDRHKVRIGYRKADAQAPGERVICPYGLILSRGNWYLVAHCDTSDGLRVFRLDRIVEALRLEEEFAAPDGDPLTSVVRDGHVFHTEDPVATVTIRYSPTVARWVAEREGVTVDGDDSLTREYPLADIDWAVRHVLQYGPEAEVLAPEEVRRGVVDRLTAARPTPLRRP